MQLQELINNSFSETDARSKIKMGCLRFRKLCKEQNVVYTYKKRSDLNIIQKVCPQCGITFYTKNKLKVTCNSSCSNRYFRGHKTINQRRQISNKLTKTRYCKWDGSIINRNIDGNRKVCKKHKNLYAMRRFLHRLGCNMNKLGTPDIWNEYNNIVNSLFTDYYISMMSLCDLEKKYNINCNLLGFHLPKIFGKPLRNREESARCCFVNRKIPVNNKPFKYKSGYHIGFNGKQYHYRSSYELEYYKLLDIQKIEYLVEPLYIKYFDTIKNIWRYAVPDLYIPSSNTIIEIKSLYTYDKQNMIDKYNEYKKQYNFKLILNKVEYEFPV